MRVIQRRVTFQLSRALSPNVPAAEQLPPLNALCHALYVCNLDWLEANPDAPSILSGHVRYALDPRGIERWLDIGQLHERKRGDCKSIASAVAAELTVAGMRAVPMVVPTNEVRPDFHVVVATDRGIYDPSITLGMPVQG